MNLASALIKQILKENDFDTWSSLKKHYLPSDYNRIYETIEKQVDLYHRLPTFEELKLAIRDNTTLEKIYAIEVIEVDAEPFLLLDYLKNEFTQRETLTKLYTYIDKSISFETAEETLNSLYSIIAEIEDKVDLSKDADNMQKLNLFDSEEEVSEYIELGLNSEFDQQVRFKNIDYILMGGRRGAGKSITCSNLANYVHSKGKSVLYFTIEMNAREILQRQCSIATGIAHHKIKYRELDNNEWLTVVKWWASRYKNTEEVVEAYLEHRNFDRFHAAVSKHELADAQIHIIYDPELTLPKFRAEAMKLYKKLGNVGLIIVDYINQMKRSPESTGNDQYDWKEQIIISKGLKSTAQELEVPVFSPFQIDKEGEARFAKGILDSADAAFTLEPGPESISFKCSKMRGDKMIDFISKTDWSCLRIGPENGIEIEKKSSNKKTSNNSTVLGGIYDDNS